MDTIAQTEAFLGHIFTGDMAAAQAMIAPEARFIGARPEPAAENPLFGTFLGPEGAAEFFTRFGALIEPGGFEIQGKIGDAAGACFYGRFRHTVRATGKPFPSDWALVTRFEGGKLVFYHFYEDTAALMAAMA